MKIIFLDIDGVLNSVCSAIAFGGYGSPHRNCYKLDPVAVGLLKVLCEKTGAFIVVSSTWRKGQRITFFEEMFAAYGWLNAPVLGLTGDHPTGFRGYEVAEWLKENEWRDVTHYICIDDDTDFTDEQKDGRFVHTDALVGFSYQNYTDALRLLGASDGAHNAAER